MNSASTASHQSPPSLTSRGTPIVFVVDDDISVRESLESLIRFAGWQPQIFASRAGIPPSPTRPRTKLPGVRRHASGPQWSRPAEAPSY